MKCPFCGFENDKVVDSRESKEADSIRRRRECLKCGKRFTTYERIDEIPYMVVKKDGRREKFDRQKVLNGLLRACEKRPVPISRLEQIVNEAEGFVIESPERERKTSEVGELIMNRLRRYDKVAYVRFASVYLDFKDVQEFMAELKDSAEDERSAGGSQQRRGKELEWLCGAGDSPASGLKSKSTAAGEGARDHTTSRSTWLTKSHLFPATASALKLCRPRCAFWKPPG